MLSSVFPPVCEALCLKRVINWSRSIGTGLHIAALFALIMTFSAASFATTATWTKLKNPSPYSAGTMLLLTDGTIMVSQAYYGIWMKLTPDSTGSYINGTWSTVESMSVPRLYFASQVLPSGEVWVAGGEYSGTGLPDNWSGAAETYNPISNRWTGSPAFPNQSGCPWIDTFGGATTNGSEVVTGILTTKGFMAGMYVWDSSGAIPAYTTITSVDSSTQIHLSANATLSAPYGDTFNLEWDSSGALTKGSAKITGIPSTTGFAPGWYIYGDGIPAYATITAVDSAHEITISAPATESVTGEDLEFYVAEQRTSCLGDASSILLSGGDIFVADPFSKETYLYNPTTNKWTTAAKKVYDANDEEGLVKLQNGSILTYDIYQSLAKNVGYAELYNPSMNTWSSISPADGTAHGTLPLLTNTLAYEIGPVLRLLDGRIFQVGANGLTALYNAATNTWAAGPTVRGTLGGSPYVYAADDAPAAELPDGHIIFAADAGLGLNSKGNIVNGSAVVSGISSPAIDQVQLYWPVSGTGIPSGAYISKINTSAKTVTLSANATATATGEAIAFGGPYNYPTELFDFNPETDTISAVSPAIPDSKLSVTPSYEFRMLMLPTGQLLLSDGSSQLWAYTPSGSPSATYLPEISSIARTAGGAYKLTGTQLTGQSAGSSYGDDVQSDENYPIVSLESSSKKVYYARTTNWSSVGVATGSTTETVDFTVPANIPAGTYSLYVSAAGLRSSAKTFVVP
jgi:hypothetical protein